MKKDSKIPYIIAAVVLSFTLLAYLVDRYQSTIISFLANNTFSELFKRDSLIQDDVYHLSYNFNNSVLSNPKVVDEIRGTDIDRFDKRVIITNDENKIGASFYQDGNKISGYGHEINYEEEFVILYIFINKNFVNKEKLTYHINTGYLGALLSATEKNKMDKNPKHTPDYDKVAEITHELSIDMYDTNNYFITIK